MDLGILMSITGEVTFPDYTWECRQNANGMSLRANYMDKDVDTGNWEIQKTRWWEISDHAVLSEVVQTMFKCVLTSKEHYSREHFKFRGRAVFGPHFDVTALWEICGKTEKRADLRGKSP
jgi:hypothetical protein